MSDLFDLAALLDAFNAGEISDRELRRRLLDLQAEDPARLPGRIREVRRDT